MRARLSEAEIRATLAQFTEAGVAVTYRQVDATDSAALTAEVSDIAAAHGSIDLVVHGAGVLNDHRIADKSPEEFASVWSTKVSTAATLADVLAPQIPLVLFASISGALGNVGQADYSAANDALDCLANVATHRRVLAVDWGPWAGGGMVSPELEREYARRGIGLVDPADGAAFLADQIKAGLPNRQVMFMRADPVAVGAVVVSEAVLHGR